MVTFDIGKCYFIETFGKNWLGRVKDVTTTEVVLQDAAWVADTGRFSEFLRTGRTDQMEVEPVGEWTVPLMYVAGKTEWPHPLITEAV